MPSDTKKALKTEQLAKSLLADIKQYMPGVVFFQREDLLHLPSFQYVATITRYAIVCKAIAYLLSTNRLTQLSRSDLALPGKKQQYKESMEHDYSDTVAELVEAHKGERLDAPSLLAAWTADQHLTLNSKRVALRAGLQYLHRHGVIERDGYTYVKRNNRNAL